MDFDKINQFKDAQAQKAKEEKLLKSIDSVANKVVKAIDYQTVKQSAGRKVTSKVEVVNQPTIEVKHTNDYAPLLKALSKVEKVIGNIAKDIVIPENEKIDSVSVSNLKDYSSQLAELIKTVRAIDVRPQVSVSSPTVKIPETKLDVSSINKKLDEVIKSFKSFKVEKTDLSKLEAATKSVKQAISSLSFPVPNYVLPYTKDGKATQATLRATGDRDAVDVAIVDASGNQITSFGGGTQYSDGDANADPTGTVAMGTDGSNVFALHTDTAGDLQVDVLSSALPTGAATAANQQTDALTDAQLRATPVPVSGTVAVTGVATATNQTSQIALQTQLESLIDTLQELVQRLSPLAGAMNNTAQLRVVQTTAPSTAVTGPITSAQSIAEKAVAGIMYTQRVAIENNTAIQSNINNAVA